VPIYSNMIEEGTDPTDTVRDHPCGRHRHLGGEGRQSSNLVSPFWGRNRARGVSQSSPQISVSEQ
jgi:hypothetical protein